MLIEFTVGNYLSFKDKKTLSLETANITEYPDNVIDAGDVHLLKTIALYGANSSGKSNLLKAVEKMRGIVLSSSKMNSTDKLGVTPFLLNTETASQPSFFEIVLLLKGTKYRYGFEVTDSEVHAEWLFVRKKNKEEQFLFIREKDELELSVAFEEGKGLEKRKNRNMLFLATVDSLGGKIANKIVSFFENTDIISGTNHEAARIKTIALSLSILSKDMMTNLLENFDLGFESIQIRNPMQPDFAKRLLMDKGQDHKFDFGKDVVDTIHSVYDNEGQIVAAQLFNAANAESAGTNKILDFIGNIFFALYVKEMVVIIDELDAKLHPILTNRLIQLFRTREVNKMSSQLIFATHDTNLLSSGNMRRDQIYFTEKDRFGATDLYSLVEYKMQDGAKVRKDRSFEKDYIAGRYGAIPFIGDIDQLIKSSDDDR